MSENYQDWVGKILEWTSPITGEKELLLAQHYTPDEDHPHHTPRFWYRGTGYLAEHCEPLPEMTTEQYEEYEQEFNWMENLRP